MKNILFLFFFLCSLTLSAQLKKTVLSTGFEVVQIDTVYKVIKITVSQYGELEPDTSRAPLFAGDSTMTADFLYDQAKDPIFKITKAKIDLLDEPKAKANKDVAGALYEQVTGQSFDARLNELFGANFIGRYRVLPEAGQPYFAQIKEQGGGLVLERESNGQTWDIDALTNVSFLMKNFDAGTGSSDFEMLPKISGRQYETTVLRKFKLIKVGR